MDYPEVTIQIIDASWRAFIGGMRVQPYPETTVDFTISDPVDAISCYLVSIKGEHGGLNGEYVVFVLNHDDEPNAGPEVSLVLSLPEWSGKPKESGGDRRRWVMLTLVLSYRRIQRLHAARE